MEAGLLDSTGGLACAFCAGEPDPEAAPSGCGKALASVAGDDFWGALGAGLGTTFGAGFETGAGFGFGSTLGFDFGAVDEPWEGAWAGAVV